MDSNKPRNSDEDCDRIVKRSIDMNHEISSQDHIRSYICSFCMRGFSNAQALGGHMNIHRRDRAKLRQLLEDRDKDDDLNEQHDSVCTADTEKNVCVDDKLGFQKLDAAEKVVELSDFIGIASRFNKERSNELSNSSGCHQNKKEIILQAAMRDGPSSSSSYHDGMEGLDLELRLGQSLTKTSEYMRKL